MWITALFFLFEGLICCVLNSIPVVYDHPDVVANIVIILTSIVFLAEVTKRIRNSKLLLLILLGYFFRILLMVCDLYWISLPNSGADSNMFQHYAINYLENGNAGRGGNYSKFLGNIYYFFGSSEIIGRYINILLSIFIIIVLIKILKTIGADYKRIVLAVAMASLLPNFAILNVITLRETIIAVLLALSLYFFILWLYNGKTRRFVFSCFLVLVASSFHSGAVAPLPAYVITLILYNRENKKLRINQKTILLAILVFVAFSWINNNYGEDLFGKFNQIGHAEDLVNRQSGVRGGSGYDVGLNISNPALNLIVNTPIRVLYFVLSPVPWDWRGLNDIISFVFSSVFYAYVFYLSFKNINKNELENRTLAIILFIMCISSAIIFAWGVENAGTALRHRDKFVAQYILLLVLVYKNKVPVRENDCLI
jgi:hypothetical protein